MSRIKELFMSILRNRFFQKFCMVPNDAVTDTRLSIPARIVYVYLLSRPDGWMVRNQEVMDSVGIKNMRAMAKCWNELVSSGWIRREKAPPKTDGAGTYSYEILETPSKNDEVIKTSSQNDEMSVQNALFAINGEKCMLNNTEYLNKEKEIKKKKKNPEKNENLSQIFSSSPETAYPFEDFWRDYGRKIDRRKCESLYRKISEKDRILIKERLPAYVAATPDIQFRKHPSTWLNGACWNDEAFIPPSNTPSALNTQEDPFPAFSEDELERVRKETERLAELNRNMTDD